MTFEKLVISKVVMTGKVFSYLQKGLKEKNTFTNVTRMTIFKNITFDYFILQK